MNGMEITQAIARIAAYMREQRDRFFAAGRPLEENHAAPMKPFFSDALLGKVRIAEKSGRKIPEPPFYEEAKALGIQNLPSLNHMASLTFVDALVFPGNATPRDLFHALVHATQFEALGIEIYMELYVRAFLHVRRDILVPLEAHAFALDTRFAANPQESFSVEEEVRLWLRSGRYAAMPHSNLSPSTGRD